MTAVFVTVVAGIVALKLLEDRLPRVLYSLVVTVVVILPLGAVPYAVWRFWQHAVGWRELGLLACLYLLTGLGISVGFHRLLTHRSFETGRVTKAVLLVAASMAAQGRCIDWAAHHLKHHAHADRDGDPHSPLDGLLHAHVGWIFGNSRAERERYCRRLLDDRLVRAIDASAALWVAIGLVVPYLVAGWSGVLWGGLVRIALVNHVSFAVNSFGHAFGSRRFDTPDESRNSWPIALLGMGEGWHNNHHAFPSRAYFGITRRELDLGGAVILALARLGLAWDVNEPSRAAVTRRLAARDAEG
jgi:stearoyl-CoA desaturase (Delta-9 desaturase)